MIILNPYLNFMGNTEEAFNFYKKVFGGEFSTIMRYKEVADLPNKDKMTEVDLEKIMNMSLKIGENQLMGTDALDSVGQKLTMGNNVSLSLGVDTKERADELFQALSVGGKIDTPMADMFWGQYFGMVDDTYGIKWMISWDNKPA